MSAWNRNPWQRPWQERIAERDAETIETYRALGLHDLAESVDLRRDPREVDARSEDELGEVFRSLGLSESAARHAARGRNGRSADRPLTESAATLTRGSLLCESARLVESQGNRRYRLKLIAGNVQGSSGYYSEAMLRRDGPRVFVEGLPSYLDHPTATERAERPERSVRDLAGHLVSTARYESDGLYADIEVYPHVAPMVESMSRRIGVSIRAYGEAEESNRPGVRGPVITSLTGAESVDFVTAAGAGGRIVGGAR
jgi:hypothetical protein